MRAAAFVALFLVLALLWVAAVSAQDGALVHPAASHPGEIASITQSPTNATKGSPVEVRVVLQEDVVAARASLIWCRVEPDYVCASPLAMQEEAEDVFVATIPTKVDRREGLVLDGTRHIGYNVSLLVGAAGGSTQDRLFAPLESPWEPGSFPEDSVGEYYFVALAPGPERSPGPSLALVLTATGLVGLGARVLRGGGRAG